MTESPPTTPPSPEWLTRGEAAAYLRITPTSLDRWVAGGILPRHRIAGVNTVRFRAEDVRQLLITDNRPEAEEGEDDHDDDTAA